MTTAPRDTPASRRTRANGDGTVYQRKDRRWEAAGYVLAPGNTRKRIHVYGSSRTEALAKLTEKVAASNRGVPIVTAQGSLAAYLTYWLENVAVHQLRETTHTRYTGIVAQYLIPGLGRKKLAKLTAKDVRTWLNELRTICQCCARGIDAGRDSKAQASRRPRCCALGKCCHQRLSPLTLAYIHSVLKSALEHAVREEEIPRNVARNVRTGTPRPRRFTPLTADEARQFLAATQEHRLAALFELALAHRAAQGRTPRPALGRPRPRRRHGQHPPHPPAHHQPGTGHPADQDHQLRAAHRPAGLLRHLPPCPPRAAGIRDRASGLSLAGRRVRLHSDRRAPDRTRHPHPALQRPASALPPAGPIRFHDLRHSTATLLLEQGVELVVIKELLGHAHIGVTATVYAHIRLRLQRQAIDLLGHALDNLTEPDDDGDPPVCAAPVR